MPDIDAEVRTLVCTADGVFIWPGAALVVRRGVSFVRASERDISNRAGTLYGPEVNYGPLIPTLERAARFLERGQVEQAKAAIARLKLPPLSPIDAHRAGLLRSRQASAVAGRRPGQHGRSISAGGRKR